MPFSASWPLSISVSSSEHGRARDNIQTSTSAGDCPCQGHMQLPGNLETAPFLCVRLAISQSVPRWKSPTWAYLAPAWVVLLLTCCMAENKLLVWGRDSIRTRNPFSGIEGCSACPLCGFSAGSSLCFLSISLLVTDPACVSFVLSQEWVSGYIDPTLLPPTGSWFFL